MMKLICAMAFFSALCTRCLAASDETHIPGPVAISRLFELTGEHVRVELADQAGKRRLIHARVNPGLTRQDLICFDQFVERRPEATFSLVEEFVRDHLRVPLRTLAGQELVERLDGGRSVRKLRAAGQTVEAYKDQYLVMGIERLDLSGPEVASQLVISTRTVAKDDPWIGRRSGQSSDRELIYQLSGSDSEYRFRLPWHENPKLCAISSVEIMAPGYCYDSPQKYERGIEFFVKYADRDNGRHRRTYRGFVELDESGYPIRAHYARAPFVDKALFAEVARAKERGTTHADAGKVARAGAEPPHPQDGASEESALRRIHPADTVAVATTETEADAQRESSGDASPLTPRETALARAFIRGHIREIRQRLLFNRPVPEYLDAAIGQRFSGIENATENGWPEAVVVTSLCRFCGIQCERNEEQAIRDLMELVEQPDADAMLAVAWMKLQRSLRENDPSEAEGAIALLQSLADWKDPVAINMLALCYQFGDGGVAVDVEKAHELWKRAAELGSPLGFCQMGYRANQEGRHREATVWFRKAAELEYTPGMYAFAERCYGGIGWGTDYDTAFYYFQKAARDGYLPAQERVADCYELGKGVDVNWNLASTWRNSAIGRGSLPARRKAAAAELSHALHHFAYSEPDAESASLRRAMAHFRALEQESGPEAQQQLQQLQTVFRDMIELAIRFAEDSSAIPRPIPKLSEEDLEEMRLEQTIRSSALLADSLELQHSSFKDRPAARAIRMSERVEDLHTTLDVVRGSLRPATGVPAFDRRAAARRFAELWAKPLAKTLYGESSREYQQVLARCGSKGDQ